MLWKLPKNTLIFPLGIYCKLFKCTEQKTDILFNLVPLPFLFLQQICRQTERCWKRGTLPISVEVEGSKLSFPSVIVFLQTLLFRHTET